MRSYWLAWLGCVLAVAVGAGGCGLTLDLEPDPDGGTNPDGGTDPGRDMGPSNGDASTTTDCSLAEDGTLCFFQFEGNGVCIGGDCIPGECGDGFVSGFEDCDDGNGDDGDGCRSDCTIGCAEDFDCPGNACSVGRCESTGSCVTEPLDDGIACPGGFCRAGVCASELCGNGMLDTDEACDDANDIRGDGCEPDCTPSCTTDRECANGVLCDGAEVCLALGDAGGAICQGPDVLPPVPSPCMYCDAATGGFELRDEDGDGYTAVAGTGCGELDCDDTNPSIYPGAPQLMNGLDNNCDGLIDGSALLTCYHDDDMDGFGRRASAGTTTGDTCPPGTVPAGPVDCNDANGVVNPEQISFFTEPWCSSTGGGCSFDYNCDGREERKHIERAACIFSTREECEASAGGWGGLTIPACGESGVWAECVWGLLGCRPALLPASRVQPCR